MAHFAKVNNGIVLQVIVAEQEYINERVETEPGKWVQTSYNTHGGIHYTEQEDGTFVESDDQSKALRMNYATVGDYYDANSDVFYRKQPWASWTLNKTTWTWEAPVEKPSTGGPYNWNEDDQTWDVMGESE